MDLHCCGLLIYGNHFSARPFIFFPGYSTLTARFVVSELTTASERTLLLMFPEKHIQLNQCFCFKLKKKKKKQKWKKKQKQKTIKTYNVNVLLPSLNLVLSLPPAILKPSFNKFRSSRTRWPSAVTMENFFPLLATHRFLMIANVSLSVWQPIVKDLVVPQ